MQAPPSMLQVTCASPDKRDQLIEAVDGVRQKYGDFGVALRPEKRTPVPALPLFDEGVWWAQDAAPRRRPDSSKPCRRSSKVLDMCSAPGGKALQLSSFGFLVWPSRKVQRAERCARI